jgi:hypothetical protein
MRHFSPFAIFFMSIATYFPPFVQQRHVHRTRHEREFHTSVSTPACADIGNAMRASATIVFRVTDFIVVLLGSGRSGYGAINDDLKKAAAGLVRRNARALLYHPEP